MLTILTIIHLIVAVGLVGFVLLQDPKGGAAGVFGGGSSSNTFFGASGATNFLTTTTKWLAGLFAVSCLILTAVTAKKSTSILDNPDTAAPAQSAPVDAGAAAPVVPAAPAEGAPAAAPANPAAPAAPAPEKK